MRADVKRRVILKVQEIHQGVSVALWKANHLQKVVLALEWLLSVLEREVNDFCRESDRHHSENPDDNHL